MSSANCPFSIFPKTDIPLNPSNPNSQKITHKYHKLNSTEVEDILELFSVFGNVVKTLALPEGSQRFCLIPAMMAHDPQKKWFDIVAVTKKPELTTLQLALQWPASSMLMRITRSEARAPPTLASPPEEQQAESQPPSPQNHRTYCQKCG
jgi:hypothetical protein